ncbi:Galactose/methyl galactoside import ATP-binding protein MglA [bioreactor metagenome]|uniref:Galactose/methyl galactoside import ATP-binding protein MglA n=1 Tax=bioreactor metagenome TaxID=1076179 RepID=A0A645G266_9ZZZZ
MLSVKENSLAAAYHVLAGKLGIFRPKKLDAPVDEVCKRLDVRMSSTKMLIRNLSGGNQQKVLLGRWLLRHCNILILDEPTRGVDVGAKYEIYRIMRDLTAQGHAIIMVSSEMPELLGMSDRIMVMCEGRLTTILDNVHTSQVDVMQYATEFSSKTCSNGD